MTRRKDDAELREEKAAARLERQWARELEEAKWEVLGSAAPEAGPTRRVGRPSAAPTWTCGACAGAYQSARELKRCRRCYAEEKRVEALVEGMGDE